MSIGMDGELVSDMFVASTEELVELTPGWKSPLSEPIWEERANPFTGDVARVPQWTPPGPFPGTARWLRLGGVRDHRASELGGHRVAFLMDALELSDWVNDPRLVRPPRIAPTEIEQFLFEIPRPAVRRLAELENDEAAMVARRMSELDTRDVMTIRASVIRDAKLEFARVEEWERRVAAMRELARVATDSERRLILIEEVW